MTTTPQTNASLQQIAQVICENDHFVLCGHVSPDGDCLGSQLALFHALKALGKHAVCVLVEDEPVPGSVAFMPGIGDMVAAGSFDGRCDVFVGLDVPNRERIGAAAAILDASQTSITVDHHASETTMCDFVYVDPDSASASIIVWDLVKLLVNEPPYESALCAYTGLVTDTGGFRFQNTDEKAFAAASELVGAGVDPAWVATCAFQSRSLASVELEALVIERLVMIAGGEGAMSWVSSADLREHGAVKADVEPLIDVIRSLAGVRVACMLREQGDYVRGSLRSKDETDVSALARELGGGGHRAASGVTLNMPLNDAVELMGTKIRDLLSR